MVKRVGDKEASDSRTIRRTGMRESSVKRSCDRQTLPSPRCRQGLCLDGELAGLRPRDVDERDVWTEGAEPV